MNEHGMGIPRSYSNAASWYSLAAEQGVDEALCRLGVLYENGEGVERSLDIAKRLY